MSGSAAETDLAIVGLACRFPGAPSPAEFWRNLAAGVESIARLSDEELEAEGVPRSVFGRPDYVKAAPVLDDPARFDAAFFGYSPFEAALIDPQQRILLELCQTALDDAGCPPERSAGPIGLFAGSAMNTYFLDRRLADRFAAEYIPTLIGSDKDFLATRISYKLGLRGPSITVQTACSTALVAVHLAAQSLLSGECDAALAGAVSVRFPHRTGYRYDGSGVVSPEGRVRAFDADANGTIFGSGAGVLVLKRLEDARESGDRIYALIKGTAVNNDGSAKAAYTAPSVHGQADVVTEALANAGMSADDLSYLEAHGSGTPIGDRIELLALTQAFRRFTARSGFCGLGSVKTNVGHLDAAAGMAGIIKTILALEHGAIPPSLHHVRPADDVDLAATPFYITQALTSWPRGPAPRSAGVMATGMGGTNAHAIVGEAPATEPQASAGGPQIWPISAKSAAALEAMAARLADRLAQPEPGDSAAGVAWSLQTGRTIYAHRRFVVCREIAEGVSTLRSAPAQTHCGAIDPEGAPPVVMLFPGVGDQYPGMGRELYDRFAIFRTEVDRCADLLHPLLAEDIRERLFSAQAAAVDPSTKRIDLRRMLAKTPPPPSPLDSTRHGQAALFTIEYALARLWMDWGVAPAMLAGHSLGEYVAACVAGVFTLPDALRLVVARARLVEETPTAGMLAAMLPEEQVRPLLSGQLSISLINGPQLCVIAGPAAEIDAFARQLTERKVIFRPVRNGHAFHSSLLDPVAARFAAVVRAVERRPPVIPFLSNVSGRWIKPAEAMDPEYWAGHLCRTARFADGIAEIWRLPRAALLEAGPGRTLGTLAFQHPARPANGRPLVVSSLRHDYESGSDVEWMLTSAGRLWTAGITPAWEKLAAAGPLPRRVRLPPYPFAGQRHWLDRPSPAPETAPSVSPAGEWPDRCSSPAWLQAGSLGAAGPAILSDALWLIAGAPGPLADACRSRLQRAGAAPVLLLNPDTREHWAAALRPLLASRPGALHVLNLQGLERRSPALHFHRALACAQALRETAEDRALQLGLATQLVHAVVGDERLDPSGATVAGIARVFPIEHPGATAFWADLPAADFADPAVAGNFAQHLLGEFARRAGGAIAYRGRFRWEETARPMALPPPGTPAPVRRHGVYLIVGGTGGLGGRIAVYLARACQARLILLKRTALPDPSRWEGTGEIAAAGGTCEIAVADVTDRAALGRVVDAARARHGRIDGAIHCAGTLADGVMELKQPASVDAVLAPKIDGVRLLYEALKPQPPDFLILFSSLASVRPLHGQSDYCAANAYLDAFGEFARADTPGLRTVVINWPIWKDVGIITRLATPAGMQASHDELMRGALTAEEGTALFARILAGAADQVVVAPRASRPVQDPAPAAQGKVNPPAPSPGPAKANETEGDDLEAQLALLWTEALGMADVGPADNFLDLGGHSLLAMQIVARIRSAYAINFTLRDFFDAPTIAACAAAIRATILAEMEPPPAS